jgi:hypothetical protein
VGSLLLFALLSLLLLLGQELSDLLIPFPFSLNVSGSILHIDLFVYFPFEFLLPLLLLMIPLILLLNLFLDETLHLNDLLTVPLPRLLDLLDVLLQQVDALVLRAVLLVRLLRERVGLDLHELADALAHQVLRVELLLQHPYLLLQVLLLLVEDARLAADLTPRLTVTVLNLQVLIRLRLVHLLLQVENLLVVLVCLLGVLVLSLLEVVIEAFDLKVELLFLVAEAIELALLTQSVLDVRAELPVREVAQLVV